MTDPIKLAETLEDYAKYVSGALDKGVEAIDLWQAARTLRKYHAALGDTHPDDLAVDRFAAAMKAKLAKKRTEGRGGWDDPNECSIEYLSYLLIQHIWKGDPIDVGNLAMMIQQRDARIIIDNETRSIMSALASHEPAPTGTQEVVSVTDEVVAFLVDCPVQPTLEFANVHVPSAATPLVRQSTLTTCQQEVGRLRRKLFKTEDRYEAEHRSHIRTGEARDKWRERAEAAEALIAALTAKVEELRVECVRRNDVIQKARKRANSFEGERNVLNGKLFGAEARNAELEAALNDLLDHVDRNTCLHEGVHRGGSIWTICDDCGKKWADDRGGFVPYSDPDPVARARAVCGRSEIQKETDHD